MVIPRKRDKLIQDRKPQPISKKSDSVPHVYFVEGEVDGNPGCRHLAMCEEGAVQAYLLHFGMMGTNDRLKIVDEGKIGRDTDRGSICFDPSCTLYGLSFPR